MLLKLALAVIPIAVIAGVLMYVAGFLWGIALIVLLVVILAVHWSHRRRSAAAATPAVQDDRQPTAVAPSTVVVVPPPLRPPRAAQPSAPPVAEADHVSLLAAYAYEKKKGGDGDGEECAVCLGEMRQGEAAKRLPACRHVFHEGCIDMWLGSHDTCPICRSPVDAGAGAGVAARVPVLVQSC